MKKVLFMLAVLVAFQGTSLISKAAYSICVYGTNVTKVDDDGTGDYTTIQAGINAASSGSCVWVKEGTYNENLTLKSGVSIYGGLDQSSWNWENRDPINNPTYVNGVAGGYITVEIEDDDYSVFDGFIVTIHSSHYYAIDVSNTQYSCVTGNKIIKNDSNSGRNAIDVYYDCSSIEVNSNQIVGTSAYSWSNGIILYAVDGDWSVSQNSVSYCYYGIYIFDPGSAGEVDQNTVTDCESAIKSGRDESTNNITATRNYIKDCSIGIDNSGLIGLINIASFNWITACDQAVVMGTAGTISDNGIWSCDIGIEDTHEDGTVTIWNNTIQGNSGSYGYGIFRNTTYTTNITNCIVVTNTVGIKASSSSNLSITYCDVYNNGTDYEGCSPGTGCISANPKFVAIPFEYVWYRDWKFYLRQNPPQNSDYSPCWDAGYSTSLFYGSTASDLHCDGDTGTDPDDWDMGAHRPDCN